MKKIDELGLQDEMKKVVEYLPLDAKTKKRLVMVCEKPSNRNKFFDQVIRPNLIVEALDQHVAMHADKTDGFGTGGSRTAIAKLEADEANQVEFTFFSNPLRMPAFGREFKRFDPRYDRKTEPPSRRGSIGAFWAFTFEWDVESASGLQTQFDWVWKKKANGKSPLGELDGYLRRNYKDYRGMVVVWSGNKSIHIHLIFDPSHLSRFTIQELAVANGTSPEAKLRNHWRGDIRPDAIWEYYKAAWWKLNDLIKTVTGIEVDFDDNLETLFQKRRLPWGVREIAGDSDFGIPDGFLVPQAVLMEELIKTSPKQASKYFLRSEEANQLPQKTKPRRDRRVQVSSLDTNTIVEPLRRYLKQHWGSDYPMPAHFEELGGELYLFFYNDQSDQNPSTCIKEDYSRLLYRGKGARTDELTASLPGGQRLGELVLMLCEQEDLLGSEAEECENTITFRPRRNIPRRMFERNASHGGLEQIRLGLRCGTALVSMNYPRLIMKNVEGSGKSTAFIRQASDFHLEDHIENYFGGSGLVKPANGFSVVACNSYEQCEQQYNEYVQWCRDTGRPVNAVLLKGFSHLYRECCIRNGMQKDKIITSTSSLVMGYPTMPDAVYDKQPEIFDEVSAIKNDAWKTQVLRRGEMKQVNGFGYPLETLIFTTHKMAQDFNTPSKSKAWLHPDFDISMPPDEWLSLATAFRAYRIIHDEIAISDLVHIAKEDAVETTKRFQQLVKNATGKAWSETRNDEKYAIYGSAGKSSYSAVGFHEMLEIAAANFSECDKVQVDFWAAPFGRDNHENGIYRSQSGQTIYIKPKDWWFRTRSRIVMTTTEQLIVDLANSLVDDAGKQAFRIELWDIPSVFNADPIILKVDSRACSRNVQELADSLLSDQIAPADVIITDIARGPRIVSHISAQGRNDLTQANIATILTHMSPDEFAKLNALAQKFDLKEVFSKHYQDRINQAAGRNSGLRKRSDCPNQHCLYISSTFMQSLGGMKFFGSGRYPAYVAC